MQKCSPFGEGINKRQPGGHKKWTRCFFLMVKQTNLERKQLERLSKVTAWDITNVEKYCHCQCHDSILRSRCSAWWNGPVSGFCHFISLENISGHIIKEHSLPKKILLEAPDVFCKNLGCWQILGCDYRSGMVLFLFLPLKIGSRWPSAVFDLPATVFTQVLERAWRS